MMFSEPSAKPIASAHTTNNQEPTIKDDLKYYRSQINQITNQTDHSWPKSYCEEFKLAPRPWIVSLYCSWRLLRNWSGCQILRWHELYCVQKKSQFYQQASHFTSHLWMGPTRHGDASPLKGFYRHMKERLPNQTHKIKDVTDKTQEILSLPCFAIILKNPNNSWAYARQGIVEGSLKLLMNFQTDIIIDK
jgi:hypothetical protein